jgi:tRNA-modifying protein YgfZ
MGQELTARTRYRGLLKRRLVPVAIAGTPPAPGTPVMQEGREVGTMRSARDQVGLAVLRLESMNGTLSCGDAVLTAVIPPWMRLPQAAS